MKKEIVSIAPGRTCLFGDHQDYLGLPVIACAINRYVKLKAVENDKSVFNISMPDINKHRVIPIDEQFQDGISQHDFLASALKVLSRYDCKPDSGFDITITADLPINAGLSSSSAFIVAWVQFLIHAFGKQKQQDAQFISQIAYEAEVLEHGAPGGKMDQFSIGLGNVLFIETGEKFSYKNLTHSIPGLIIGESGIPKQTVGLLSELKGKAIAAIQQLQAKVENFQIKNAEVNDIEKYEGVVDEDLFPYLKAAIGNHAITKKAFQELKKEKPDFNYIGDLMNQHHFILKDLLKITVPKIDEMIEAALSAGAIGAKIVGSGGGGSIVALSPLGKEQKIINAIIEAGGNAAYKVKVDSGTRIIGSPKFVVKD